jgi:4-amino-4-deoxy-L-arabinose transferase-like glycosyltransferase
MGSRILPAGLLFLASIAFQTLFIGFDIFPSDEGLILLASEDIANGKVLYRDIHVPLTPLIYLLQGFIFKVFGASMLVSRLSMSVTYALIVVLVFLISRQCMSTSFAFLAAFCAILLQLWVWPHAHFLSYTPLAVLFSMISLYLAWSVESTSGSKGLLLLLGASTAITAWAKPNLGVLTGLAVLFYWFACWIRSRADLPLLRPRRLSDLLREGLLGIVGAAAVSLAIVGYLWASDTLQSMIHGLREMVDVYGKVPHGLFPSLLQPWGQLEDLRVNLLLTVPGILHSPLMFDPGLHQVLDYTSLLDALVRLLHYLPPAILAGSFLHLGCRLKGRRWGREDEAILLTSFVTLTLYLSIIPHPAIHYLFPAQVPSIVLGCFLCDRAWGKARARLRGLLRPLVITLFASYALLSAMALTIYLTHPRTPVFTRVGTLWVERGQGKVLNEMLAYVEQNVPPGEQVFVFPYYPMFYFITGLQHATRYTDVRPLSPGPMAEAEIIRHLEEENIRFAFYFPATQFKGLESFEAAYPRLHRNVMTRFEVDREFHAFYGLYAKALRRPPRGKSPNASR